MAENRVFDKTRPYIFVSYSHMDEEAVEKTVAELYKRYGLNIWYDNELYAGRNWDEIALRKVRSSKCKMVLLFASQDALTSENVKIELDKAKYYEKVIVPINFDGIPFSKLIHVIIEKYDEEMPSKVDIAEEIIRDFLDDKLTYIVYSPDSDRYYYDIISAIKNNAPQIEINEPGVSKPEAAASVPVQAEPAKQQDAAVTANAASPVGGGLGVLPGDSEGNAPDLSEANEPETVTASAPVQTEPVKQQEAAVTANTVALPEVGRSEALPDSRDDAEDAEGFHILYGTVLCEYSGNSRDVSVPNGVIKIGSRAFAGNKAIQSIAFPRTVKNIEQQAFSGCTELKMIELPYGLTSLAIDAFLHCPKICISYSGNYYTKDNIEKLYRQFIKKDTFTICNSVLTWYTGAGGDIIIPSGVNVISARAFSFNPTIKSVRFHRSVTEIRTIAFSGCENLASIDFPSGGLINIGANAFSNCAALTSVTVHKNTTLHLENRAFANCGNITISYKGNTYTQRNIEEFYRLVLK